MKTKSRLKREKLAIEQRKSAALQRAGELANAPYNTHDWKKSILWQSTARYYWLAVEGVK